MPPFTVQRGTAAVLPDNSVVVTLQDNEFRVVISSLPADEALTGSLLTVQLTGDGLRRLIGAIESDPSVSVEVDVLDRIVRAGTVHAEFRLDEHLRQQLIHGLDPDEATMVQHRLIADFEGRRQPPLPTAL